MARNHVHVAPTMTTDRQDTMTEETKGCNICRIYTRVHEACDSMPSAHSPTSFSTISPRKMEENMTLRMERMLTRESGIM